MAKARARAATRKVKDKWKTKQWYSIFAPPMFNKAAVGETLSDDPNKVMGRVASTTLQDLTGDFKLMHVKVDFQVHAVTGTQADTFFVGHSLTSDYVRRLVRRNHSKISCVFDVATQDGAMIRVKPFAVTDRRAQSSQQTQLREVIGKTLAAEAAERPMSAFVHEMLDGKLAAKLYKACRILYPLRKIEVNKSEVRRQPTAPQEPAAPVEAQPAAAAPPEPALTPEEGGEEPAPEEEVEAPAAPKA